MLLGVQYEHSFFIESIWISFLEYIAEESEKWKNTIKRIVLKKYTFLVSGQSFNLGIHYVHNFIAVAVWKIPVYTQTINQSRLAKRVDGPRGEDEAS